MNGGRIVRRVIAPAAALVIGACVLAFTVDSLPVAADAPVPEGLPSCAFEDSMDCVWDAGTSGNGSGRSFYDVGGTVHYLP